MRRPIGLNEIPSAPPASIMNPLRGPFSVILPVARTNLITNPSFETGTTSWVAAGASSIAQSAVQQYHGVYSLAVTPTAASLDGAAYTGTLSLTAGTTYVASCKLLGIAGKEYRIVMATSAGVALTQYYFIATGRWQWVWVFYTETANNTRRVYISKSSHTSTGVFYIDGVQVEAINAGETVSTYIDGDQHGLLPGQFPPPYGWTGTPHASTSYRLSTTRAGGQVVNLDSYKYKVIGHLGLGVTGLANVGTEPGVLDGATFQATIARSRSFVINGFVDTTTGADLDRQRTSLANAFGPDSASPRQPAVLVYQKFDCLREASSFARIIASYDKGLEGQADNPFRETMPLTFTQWRPEILAGDNGASLTAQLTVTNANGVIRRNASGVWSALSTGVSGGAATVYAIAVHPNGTVYIGGDFTDAGGSGADYAAIYNPITNAFSVIKAATSFNNTVRAIAIGPDGKVYFGGAFTNVDGIANADGVVAYDPVANTFAALGTGYTPGGGIEVRVLAFGPTGILFAGGDPASGFGGVANTGGLAQWNGTTWATVLGAAAANRVVALCPVGGLLYWGWFGAVGAFRVTVVATTATTAYNTSSSVSDIVRGVDGKIYLGGNFTTIAGVAYNYIASFDGAGQFSRVGDTSALNAAVRSMAVGPTGLLYLAGDFTTVNGDTFPDKAAIWNGSTYLPLDVNLPGAAAPQVFTTAPDGSFYIGFDTSGSAVAGATTTVTNTGTMRAYPTVKITGPSSGTSRLFQLWNVTTGRYLYLNYTISAGETLVLQMSQGGIIITSSSFGAVAGVILPGSSPDFALEKGVNIISLYADASSVTATIQWTTAFQSIADLTD